MAEALSGEDAAFSAFREGDSDTGPWVIALISQHRPDETALHSATHGAPWSIEELPEIDWLAHSYRQFPAFSVDDFFIYGSHHDGPVPGTQIGLQIDAATAFGSGEHGTTAGCLQAMLSLQAAGLCPWNVLDMGTGSGILALAAFKLWKTPVLGVDNDAEAVRVADHHRTINGVPQGAAGAVFETGDGFAAAGVQARMPFDLVIANILAGPLVDMAAQLAAVCDDNAHVILSGILNTQAGDVITAYERQGLRLTDHLKIEKWTTLVLRRP